MNRNRIDFFQNFLTMFLFLTIIFGIFLYYPLRVFGTEVDSKYKKALDSYIRGDFAKSQKVLEQLRDAHWDNYNIVLLAAFVTWKQGKKSWALANFDRAIQISPGKIAPYIGKAELYLDMGKLKNAEEIALKCLKKFPQKWEASLILAKIYLKQRKMEKTIFSAERGISIKSNSYKLYNILGLAYLSKDKYGLAYIAFKTANSFAPNSAYILNNLGVVMEKKKDYKKAREYYNKCLKIDPAHPTARTNLKRL